MNNMNKVEDKTLRVLVQDHQVTVPPSDVYPNQFLYSDFRIEQMLAIPMFVRECMNTNLPSSNGKTS